MVDRKPQHREVNMDWFYQDYRWRKFSKGYKKRHLLCVDCLEEGITSPTKVTDHIERFEHGGQGFDLDDLKDEYFKPLCNKHHNKKSGKQRHGFKGDMG